MKDSTRALWRAIRDAGEIGLSRAAIRTVLGDECNEKALEARLFSMKCKGYIEYSCRRWVAGDRVPPGESPAFGAGPLPQPEPARQGPGQRPLRAAPRSRRDWPTPVWEPPRPPRVNSIWQLGQLVAACA